MSRAYHHGDLRNALVTAAVELLATTSAADLSLREVARRAGVTTGAPYHHFKTRADLLVEVACAGFAGLAATMGESDEGSRSAVDRLEARCLVYMRFALAHGAHYRVMFSPELRTSEQLDRYDRVARESFLGLVAAVRAVRPEIGEPEASSLAFSVWAAAHGAVLLALDGASPGLMSEQDELPSQLRATARHLTSMVRADRSPPGG